MKTILEKNKRKSLNIKAVALDNDGVLTDNAELIGFPNGYVLKRRSHYDGQGISFLRAIGIRIVVITGDSGHGAVAINQLVDKWNRLPSVVSGRWEPVKLFTGCMGEVKKEVFRQWAEENNLKLSQCAMMGDDYVDLPLMRVVGFTAAPGSAEKPIRDLADFVSNRSGGSGAVRDLANFILEARGINPATLPVN